MFDTLLTRVNCPGLFSCNVYCYWPHGPASGQCHTRSPSMARISL